MCARRLLLLGFISIIEIGSVQISPKKPTHLRSPFHRHPIIPGPPADKNSRYPQFYNSPNGIFRNPNSAASHYYGPKKINHWLDPIKLKKLRELERLNPAIRPHKFYPPDAWNERDIYAKKLEKPDRPSLYLEPPKLHYNSDYAYYSKDKDPSADLSKENSEESTEYPQNHKSEVEEDEESAENDHPTYVRDHAPELQVEASDDVKTNESEDSNSENVIGAPESPKDRVEFHIHGHEGPQTYIFGYDTGDGANRQFRLEERHGDGSVTGQYGYIDPRGKLRKVRYKASPTDGYVEKHHDSKEQQEV